MLLDSKNITHSNTWHQQTSLHKRSEIVQTWQITLIIHLGKGGGGEIVNWFNIKLAEFIMAEHFLEEGLAKLYEKTDSSKSSWKQCTSITYTRFPNVFFVNLHSLQVLMVISSRQKLVNLFLSSNLHKFTGEETDGKQMDTSSFSCFSLSIWDWRREEH